MPGFLMGIAVTANETARNGCRKNDRFRRAHAALTLRPARQDPVGADRDLIPTSGGRTAQGVLADHLARSMRTRSEFSRRRSNTIRLPSGVISNVRIAAPPLRRVSGLRFFVA